MRMESRGRGMGLRLRPRKYLFVQCAVALAIALFCTSRLFAQETAGNIPSDAKASLPSLLPESSAASPAPVPTFAIPDLRNKETFSSAMQIIILLTVLSLRRRC